MARPAHFYTIVTRDTRDQEFSANRQLFLTEQGYRYTIEDAETAGLLVERPEGHHANGRASVNGKANGKNNGKTTGKPNGKQDGAQDGNGKDKARTVAARGNRKSGKAITTAATPRRRETPAKR